MKILESAKKLELGNMRFVCSECGCIFEAENNEYTHVFDVDRFEDHYLVEGCPECGRNVYLIIQRPLEEERDIEKTINHIDCINCIHYKLMYERNPKQVHDGCEKYGLYLKNDSKNHSIVPCNYCIDDECIFFKDVRRY